MAVESKKNVHESIKLDIGESLSNDGYLVNELGIGPFSLSYSLKIIGDRFFGEKVFPENAKIEIDPKVLAQSSTPDTFGQFVQMLADTYRHG